MRVVREVHDVGAASATANGCDMQRLAIDVLNSQGAALEYRAARRVQRVALPECHPSSQLQDRAQDAAR